MGHDGRGFGAGWHLDMVEVQDTSTDRKYNFPCSRWLAEDEDDKQIIRDLSCSNLPEEKKSVSTKRRTTYHVSVVTSDKRDADSYGDAWIVIHDDAGNKTKKIRLAKGRAGGRGLAGISGATLRWTRSTCHPWIRS